MRLVLIRSFSPSTNTLRSTIKSLQKNRKRKARHFYGFYRTLWYYTSLCFTGQSHLKFNQKGIEETVWIEGNSEEFFLQTNPVVLYNSCFFQKHMIDFIKQSIFCRNYIWRRFAMKKRIVCILLSFCVMLSLCAPALAVRGGGTAGFQDVSSDAYYAGAVQWPKENDITTGTSQTTFSPANFVTRGEAVTFLWRASGRPAPSSQETPFTDLAEDWYRDAVCWAAEKKITTGVTETSFDPNAKVTRVRWVTPLLPGRRKITCSQAHPQSLPQRATTTVRVLT